MTGSQPSSGSDASQDEVQLDALAWANFLYEEYLQNKHKQLLLGVHPKKIDTEKEGNN